MLPQFGKENNVAAVVRLRFTFRASGLSLGVRWLLPVLVEREFARYIALRYSGWPNRNNSLKLRRLSFCSP